MGSLTRVCGVGLLGALACATIPAEPPGGRPAAVATPPASRAAYGTLNPAGPVDPADDPCDEYLTLYQSCETRLAAAIAAGERRTAKAERARIEYLRGTPEAAQLPDACREMKLELLAECTADP